MKRNKGPQACNNFTSNKAHVLTINQVVTTYHLLTSDTTNSMHAEDLLSLLRNSEWYYFQLRVDNLKKLRLFCIYETTCMLTYEASLHQFCIELFSGGGKNPIKGTSRKPESLTKPTNTKAKPFECSKIKDRYFFLHY